GRVRDAGLQAERGADFPAAQVLEVIVDDDVALINDADAAGVLHAVAEKEIADGATAFPMTKHQTALRTHERVVPVNVVAGFAGDNFHVAVAVVEVVGLDEGVGTVDRSAAIADGHGFTSVAAAEAAVIELVVIDD